MRAQRRYTPSRATTLPTGMDGATQIGSKHASQTKLLHGLTSSRIATIFAVPRQLDRTRSYSDQFSYLWGAAGPCVTLTLPVIMEESPVIRQSSQRSRQPMICISSSL